MTKDAIMCLLKVLEVLDRVLRRAPLAFTSTTLAVVQANMSTKVSRTWCLLFFEPSCERGKAFMQHRQANLENVPVEEDHVDRENRKHKGL